MGLKKFASRISYVAGMAVILFMRTCTGRLKAYGKMANLLARLITYLRLLLRGGLLPAHWYGRTLEPQKHGTQA